MVKKKKKTILRTGLTDEATIEVEEEPKQKKVKKDKPAKPDKQKGMYSWD